MVGQRGRPNELHINSLWDWDGKKREKAKYGTQHDYEISRRLEKLSVICRAMWTLIQERSNISEKELMDRTTEIDLLDGRADGRVSVPARQCTKCNHTVAPRHERCLYCGSKQLIHSVFETV